MTAQEQAFRTYYGSMSDAELLQTAAHRDCYIPIAQTLMAEEMSRRHLAVSEVPPPARKTEGNAIARLMAAVRRRHAHQ